MHLFVEVIFYSNKRNYLPSKGYRPDAIFNDKNDYWGITFSELPIEEFDTPTPATIVFTFQDHYNEVVNDQKFRIMEGRDQVAEGIIISIEKST